MQSHIYQEIIKTEYAKFKTHNTVGIMGFKYYTVNISFSFSFAISSTFFIYLSVIF